MKKTIKLIPAIVMLLVSAILVSTSTYAWFSMNTKVTVTGMTIRTVVSDNLLISGDTLASTTVKDDDTFFSSLVQSSDNLVEPVSTVNGKAFFFTNAANVKGDGDAILDTYNAYNAAEVPTSSELTDFNTAYNTTGAVGYVDYVFQLKAINSSAASQIRLTKLALTYGGASPANNNKAYRVAVFAEDLGYKTGTDATTNMSAPAGGSGTLKSIFTPTGATNFTDGEAVTSTSATAAVTYNGAVSLPVGTNRTQYYKVVVRLWLEGEDNTCNNSTFMDLKDKWSLDLQFNLVENGTADPAEVTSLALAYTATKTALTIGTDNGIDAGKLSIAGVDYYPIDGKTLGTAQLYISGTKTLAANSHIFTIDGSNYPTEVTNQVTINPAP